MTLRTFRGGLSLLGGARAVGTEPGEDWEEDGARRAWGAGAPQGGEEQPSRGADHAPPLKPLPFLQDRLRNTQPPWRLLRLQPSVPSDRQFTPEAPQTVLWRNPLASPHWPPAGGPTPRGGGREDSRNQPGRGPAPGAAPGPLPGLLRLLLPSAPGTDPSLGPHTRELGIPAPSAPDARAPTRLSARPPRPPRCWAGTPSSRLPMEEGLGARGEDARRPLRRIQDPSAGTDTHAERRTERQTNRTPAASSSHSGRPSSHFLIGDPLPAAGRDTQTCASPPRSRLLVTPPLSDPFPSRAPAHPVCPAQNCSSRPCASSAETPLFWASGETEQAPAEGLALTSAIWAPRSDPTLTPHQAAVRRVTSRCPSRGSRGRHVFPAGLKGGAPLTGPRPHPRRRGSLLHPRGHPRPCALLFTLSGDHGPAPGPWGSFQALSPLTRRFRGRRWTGLPGAGLGVWEGTEK